MKNHEEQAGANRSQGRTMSPPNTKEAKPTRERTSGRSIPVPDEPIDVPPASIAGDAPAVPADDGPTFKLPPLPIRGLKPLMYAGLALFTIYIGFELYSTAISLWAVHWVFGLLFLSVVTAVLVLGITAATSYLRGSDSARELESIREISARIRYTRDKGEASFLLKDLKDFYKGKPQYKLLEESISQLQDYSDDGEVLRHMERNFFRTLDDAAIQKVSGHCLYTGTAIALSPWAVMDVGFALWRNVRLVEEISAIYGFRPSFASRLKLLRMVVAKMAFVGGSQVLMNSAAESVSRLGVGIPVFAAFAQGVGAAIYTGRIGIAAIDCTRPVEFIDGEGPNVSALVSPTIDELKRQVAKRAMPGSETA